MAASHFTRLNLVAVVGEDFPAAHLQLLNERGVDLEGLDQQEGETFFWRGRYGADWGDAETLETQLNVFEHFQPTIPDSYQKSPYLFLGNIHPTLQLQVLEQVERPKLVGADTMNLWINHTRAELIKLLGELDLLIINESEAKLLSGEGNLFDAVDVIRSFGPKHLVIKRGAYGAILFHSEGTFFSPAYPLRALTDPTGAGDSFAAGFMGHIAREDDCSFDMMKRAVLTGTVMASLACEGFSFDEVISASPELITARIEKLTSLIQL